MRTMRGVVLVTLMIVAAPNVLGAPRTGTAMKQKPSFRRAATILDNDGRMNANNLDMVVTNHGSIAYDNENGIAGLIYPKGSLKAAVYAAGLWVGAKVDGDVRATVGEYSQEFVPGPMLNGTFQPDRASFRNYRIERGNTSSTDYLNWPVDQGAPVDSMGNPALLGDVMIWSVFNDADPTVHTNAAGDSPPLGIEVQQSVFAFRRSGALGDVIFVKWKILNKGSNLLDSTYVSVWADPDLGGFTDDLVGCDTTRSLGYCYNATNSDNQYGTAPPAVGFDFFLGPVIRDSTGAVIDTLGMTSFNKYINGTDPGAAFETYNYMKGLNADSSEIHVCNNPSLPVTKFQVSGLDPGAPSSCPGASGNWLDSSPADRRLFLSSGPFTMAPGDSQEVVTAIIMGQGTDRISSIEDLKSKDDVAQLVFDLNFDIPPPPPSPTVYVQPLDRGVRLVWGSESVGYVATSDTLNQEFHFEGFRVWQMASNDPNAQPTVIATFDEANGVTNIYQDEFNATTGGIERRLKAAGTDHGLDFTLDITQDAIRGGRLINNKDYYFAVTAYAYDVNNVTPYQPGTVELGIVSELLESPREPIRVAPLTSSAVFSTSADAVSAGALNVSGFVDVQQLIQNQITGQTYRITFDDREHWWLVNTATGDTLLADQDNVFGGFDTPVTEGFMVQVHAPRGVAAIGELQADSTLTDLTPQNPDTTGTWYFSNLEDVFDGDFGLDIFPFISPNNHDYEIRILPDTTQYAWTYASGEVSFVHSFKQPFEIYDLGFNSLDDPSDDVKVSAMVRDIDLSGTWSWGDWLYFRDIPYDSVAWDDGSGNPNPVTKSTDYGNESQPFGRFAFTPIDSAYYTATALDSIIPPETTIRVIAQRFTSEDAFEFRTLPVGSAPGTVVQTDFKKMLAVPNPYYAHSQYELTQFNRVIKFTNIPAARKVTLRIFNMGGDLVRTIVREATTADEMAVATMTWDLNTERNLPVASGVYIWRLDVEGVGSKTDRLAVFVEEERLDNF
ncbi:MAG TPA: hypothetical protein VFP58_13570 [Candidatus Eisenbacteria bacterium]|nr:hypothetical protein [Candidatus Eisenbacteria bacterium]